MEKQTPKKELHYSIKILFTMYSMILYLFAPRLVEMITGINLSKIQSTSISLVVAAILFLWFIPLVIGVPKKQKLGKTFYTIGLRKPNKIGIHILLGIVLGCCTLGGMLIGSLIIGGYTFNIENLSINQIYFSILPGIFEEIIFRGFLMSIFVMLYKNTKKAAIIQCIIFVLLHIGSFEFDWHKIVDLYGVFVLSIGFTYVAYKTRNLLAGIIFHYLHDAFLFVVQLNQETVFSPLQAFIFYGCLTLSVVLVIIITKVVTERKKLGSKADPLWE